MPWDQGPVSGRSEVGIEGPLFPGALPSSLKALHLSLNTQTLFRTNLSLCIFETADHRDRNPTYADRILDVLCSTPGFALAGYKILSLTVQ